MDDSQLTRFVRLRADVDREAAENSRTRCVGTGTFERVVFVDHRSLFNRHQRRMSQMFDDYPKPGVAVFALHWSRGIAGHFWLAATEHLRAGTIGRHSSVELFLDDDPELSLRHLLVAVKACATGVRIRFADLATPSGFQAEEGGLLRAADANGTVILRAATYSLFAFPTGTARPWNRDAEDPWSTLPRRILVSDQRPERSPPVRRVDTRHGDTLVELRDGPAEPGPEPLIQPREPLAGRLVITHGTREVLEVGSRALDRGVILGRYSRCTGDTAAMSQAVSRVHAVLLQLDGELHLIDVGSTNGTFDGEREIKCARVVAGSEYRLAEMRVRWESIH